MSIASKLEYLDNTKDYIRQCIQQKGVTVPSGTTFRQYGDKILEIETEQHPPDWGGEGGEYEGELTVGTAIATGQDFVLSPPKGYDGFSSVNVMGDYNLKPENIAEGITIYGVTGTMKLTTNTSTIPEAYLSLFEQAKQHYSGDYANLMILESDDTVAFGFLKSDFSVDNYDSSNTEFYASNWVYVAYNKKTQVWKVEPWDGKTSNGNSYVKNIRYCDRYIYWNGLLIYPMVNRPSSQENVFSFTVNVTDIDYRIMRFDFVCGNATTIDYGDGTALVTYPNGYTSSRYVEHTYASTGTYTVTIKGPMYSSSLGKFVSDFLTPLPPSITSLKDFCHLANANNTFSNDFQIIPDNLFQLIENPIYDASWLLGNSRNLSKVPSGIFSTLRDVLDASYLFSEDTSLTDIPADLLFPFENVKTLSNAFQRTKIQNIPEGFFDKCLNLENAFAIFSDDSVLSSIPSNLFSKCSKLNSLRYAFSDCYGLAKIGTNIFPKNSENQIDCYHMFYDCKSLLSIPSDFFDSLTNPSNIEKMFYGCSSIMSNLPPIWENPIFQNIPHGSCFSGCDKAPNYSKVPTGWK